MVLVVEPGCLGKLCLLHTSTTAAAKGLPPHSWLESFAVFGYIDIFCPSEARVKAALDLEERGHIAARIEQDRGISIIGVAAR